MRFDRADKVPAEPHCNPSIERAFGVIGYQLGDRAEALVDEAFLKMRGRGALPKWLYNWVHNRKYSKEDMSGIDFVFITDVGAILVNIKSSEAMARKFKETHRNKRIHTAIVNVCDSPEIIYQKLIGQLSCIRKEMI